MQSLRAYQCRSPIFKEAVKSFENRFVIQSFQLPWKDVQVEERMELTMGIVRTIRSVRQEYMLNKTKADGRLHESYMK